jgi:hypothetical protein
VQKFTRPITREIELAGERLALTFTEEGLSVRPVGSRRPPWEVSWSAVLGFLTLQRPSHEELSGDELTRAVQALKSGTPPAPARRTEPPPSAPPAGGGHGAEAVPPPSAGPASPGPAPAAPTHAGPETTP